MLRRDGSTLSLILDPAAVPAGKPGAVHPSHFGLNVDSPQAVDRWHRHLKDAGAPHVGAPKGHRDGSYGFYVRDTEGNSLEIIFIPPAPGNPAP